MIVHAFRQFVQDITAMPVLLHGLLAAVGISLVCSTLSVFVVLRRLAFIGEGIAHSALGGIALGILLFVSGPMIDQTLGTRFAVDLTTGVFCVLVAWLIGWTSRKKIISEDASIGIFLVASMAFGIILISLRRQYTADLFSFLFGSVLAVGLTDVYLTLVLAILVLAAVAIFFRPMFLFCLDEELALANGIPVGPVYYALLTVLAVTIVLSVKILGVLLIAAFLVIPGAAARMLTYRYRTMFLIANVVGLLGILGGLVVSDVLPDLPSGPTIVMAQFVLFVLALLWSRFRDRFLPGRQMTPLGLTIVVTAFLIVLAAGTAAFTPAGRTAPAVQPAGQTTVHDADWKFFLNALKTKDYDKLNARIDRDPVFVEQITQQLRQLPLPDSEKQTLLDAFNATNWPAIPDQTLKKLRS